MAVISFDVTAFRARFPEYANASKYPTPALQGYFDSATCFVSNANYGCLQGACRAQALNLMTAHLVYLSGLIASGDTPGMIQSSTVDKISVTLTPPPFENQWQYWLQLSPYGSMLLALLQAAAVGGFFVPGLPETSAFRKVGGVF